MCQNETYAVEVQKMYTGYCPECSAALELDQTELDEAICPACASMLKPYCEDEN